MKIFSKLIGKANFDRSAVIFSNYDCSVFIKIISISIFIWNIYSLHKFIDDDAYISLKYAKNLADHAQITWNLGEKVEGYTNFLQIILTATLVKLGVEPLSAVRWINVTAVAGLFAATASAAKRLMPRDRLAPAIGGFLIASAAPVTLWIWGGLEADLTAALIAAAMATCLPLMMTKNRHLARGLAAGILFGLAYLSRPEALVAAGVTIVSIGCGAPGPATCRLRIAAMIGAVTTAVVLVHLAWRLSYYGDWAPNTLYAKMALPLWRRLLFGAPYVLKSMLMLPSIPLGLIGAGCAIRAKALTPEMRLLATVVAVYVASVLWVGGDHMYGARMLVPIVGPASMLVVAGLQGVANLAWRRGLVATLVAIESLIGLAFPRYRMDYAAFGGALVGRYIDHAWPAGALVALHTAGSTPYFAPKLRYIDMLGLNDRAIAHRAPTPIRTPIQLLPGHAKGDGAYVLRRAPAYIIAGPAEGGRVEKPIFLTDVELAENPGFRRCYGLETVRIPYTPQMAAQDWLTHPRPLVFTYYRRRC